jgi:hypothetical protein
MILMFLLQFVLPDRFRWIKAAPDAPETTESNPHSAGKPPWGEMQALPITLARPDNYFTNLTPPSKATTWFLPAASWTALVQLVESMGLDGKTRSFLLSNANWEKKPDGFQCFPPSEVILALTPTLRARLYNQLGQAEQNTAQRNPFRLRQEGMADWFNESGLAEEKISLVKKLLYTNEETVCFADLSLFAQLSLPAETLLLMKSISRVPTYMLKLHVDPEANIDSLLKHWARFGNVRDMKILVRSLSRAD